MLAENFISRSIVVRGDRIDLLACGLVKAADGAFGAGVGAGIAAIERHRLAGGDAAYALRQRHPHHQVRIFQGVIGLCFHFIS